eukprot:2985191-Lingulodinium_polyedra.AAC.1
MLLENVVLTIKGLLPEDLRATWTRVNGGKAGADGNADGNAEADPAPGPAGKSAREREGERFAAWIAQHGARH